VSFWKGREFQEKKEIVTNGYGGKGPPFVIEGGGTQSAINGKKRGYQDEFKVSG